MIADCGGGGLRSDGGLRRIHKMRTITLAKECGQNPTPKVKKIDLYENRTTEGGESKVCRTTEGGESKISKTYLGTEPPKVVSLKFAKPPKVVSLKLKFL